MSCYGPNDYAIGTFVRCDRAWGKELKRPCWYVMVSHGVKNALILKGKFKPEQKLKPGDLADVGAPDDNLTSVSRCTAVSVDEVPEDALAVYTRWVLLGGLGANAAV